MGDPMGQNNKIRLRDGLDEGPMGNDESLKSESLKGESLNGESLENESLQKSGLELLKLRHSNLLNPSVFRNYFEKMGAFQVNRLRRVALRRSSIAQIDVHGCFHFPLQPLRMTTLRLIDSFGVVHFFRKKVPRMPGRHASLDRVEKSFSDEEFIFKKRPEMVGGGGEFQTPTKAPRSYVFEDLEEDSPRRKSPRLLPNPPSLDPNRTPEFKETDKDKKNRLQRRRKRTSRQKRTDEQKEKDKERDKKRYNEQKEKVKERYKNRTDEQKEKDKERDKASKKKRREN